MKIFLYEYNGKLQISQKTFRELGLKSGFEIVATFNDLESAKKTIKERYKNSLIIDSENLIKEPIKPREKRISARTHKPAQRYMDYLPPDVWEKVNAEYQRRRMEGKKKKRHEKARPLIEWQKKHKGKKKPQPPYMPYLTGEAREKYFQYRAQTQLLNAPRKPRKPRKYRPLSSKTKKLLGESIGNLVWVCDPEGKTYRKPKDFVLPLGWRYGRGDFTNYGWF